MSFAASLKYLLSWMLNLACMQLNIMDIILKYDCSKEIGADF